MKRIKALNKEWLIDGLVAAAILSYSGLVWWPIRNLPISGENGVELVGGAVGLLGRNFTPLALLELNSSQPPLLQLLLAQLWNWLGNELWVAQTMMALALPVLMLGTYWLGKRIGNPLVAMGAAFLVGVSPSVLAAYGSGEGQLWMAALGVMGVAGWWWGRKKLGVMALTLATLINLSAWFYVIGLWVGVKKSKEENRDQKWLLVPILAGLVWLMYHNGVAGWWLLPPGSDWNGWSNLGALGKYFGFVAQVILTWHWRFLISVPAFMVLVWWWRQKEVKVPYKRLTGMLVIAGLFWIYWSLKGGFEETLVAAVLPFLMVIGCGGIYLWLQRVSGFNSNGYFMVVIGLLALSFIGQWRGDTSQTQDFVFRSSGDLGYQDRVSVSRKAAGYVAYAYPEAEVVGGFPEVNELTEPILGFVEEPVDFLMCSEFEKSQRVQLLYIHPYDPSQLSCREVANRYQIEMETRLVSRGKWVEIYRIGDEIGREGNTEEVQNGRE